MRFQAVKGTRDFYPQEMRLRKWITDAWRRVSLRNGFEEFDSPIFEYLDLFTAKSGPEIAEQLFNFTDRGGRQLAIRPEITPSLARMVNAKVQSLPRPIKWFSIPRVCRAENPQQGRLREFFQWNIDVIGEESELADAECVFVAVDALRELGLTAQDIVIRYSSRELLSAVLRGVKIEETKIPGVMAVLDKRKKVPAETFAKMLADAVAEPVAVAAIQRFMDTAEASGPDLAGRLGVSASEAIAAAQRKLAAFEQGLAMFGVAEWCRYDPAVVRGLAYYTGIVYEIFDSQESLRAVAGGGRYDNLLEVLGGPRVTATGMGMGDVVLGILLAQKKLLPPLSARLDYFVVDGADGLLETVIRTTAALRQKGWAADYGYKRGSLAKQLKEANRRGARATIIVRSPEAVSIKDMVSADSTPQKDMSLLEFLDGVPNTCALRSDRATF